MKFEMMSDAVAEEMDKRQLAIDKLQWALERLVHDQFLEDEVDLAAMRCVCDSCLEIHKDMDEYKDWLKEQALKEATQRKKSGYEH